MARGATLGRYAIVGTLGHGGMGTILRGYDEALGRAVAIKLLRCGTTERHAERLRREAQALARLSHPNVVHVYEVGQAHEQWFIAMELVPGQTLREWHADEHHWRECVRVYLQAGAGLAAAHAAGLVHRDFKPDNCIIDEEGRVRVLDFGLVRDAVHVSRERATVDAEAELGESEEAQRSPMTRTGAVLGTVAYMPPEQLEGQRADARSDQFSFCVSLYEAVYGERPFKGGSITTLMDSIRRGRVRRPPRGRTVPTALRSVLLRGLAGDPEARWPSMDSLLGQLQQRVAPRRRRWTAVGVTVGLVAVGGGVALGQYAQVMDRCTGASAELQGVWDDARRKRLEAAILGTERSYAADTWVRVEQRLDDYAEHWADRHTATCEATRVTQEQTEADMGLRMSCLHDRKVALRSAVDVLADADAVVVENAVKLVAGLPDLRRCDDLGALRAAVPPPEDPEVAQQVEALRDRLVQHEAEQQAGRYASALEAVEAVVAQAEALGYGPLIAEAKARRGQLLDRNGRYPEAEQDLREAYALAMAQRHDDTARDAAQDLTWVVGVRQARYAEGLVWGRVALAHVTRDGGDLAPRHEASVLKSIGTVLSYQGEFDEALANQQRALAILERALGDNHPEVGAMLDGIGIALAKQGKLDEALTHQRRALAIIEDAMGRHHPNTAAVLNNISIVLRMQGALDEALIHQQRALAIQGQAWGDHHPVVATALDNIGSVLIQQGKLDEGRAYYLRALAIREEALGDRHPDIAGSLNNLGNLVSDQGRLDEALAYYRRALPILEEALGPQHADIAATLNNLGIVLVDQGKLDEALVYLRRAQVIFEATVGEHHPNVGALLNSIGRVLVRQGQLDEGLTYLRRALAIREETLGRPHTAVAASLNDIGDALRRRGELDQSRSYHERALAVWEEALGTQHSEVANALVGLAAVTLEQRDFEAARMHAERAVALRESGEYSPAEVADARFVLAQSMWARPSERSRARALPERVRDAYEQHGASRERDLAVVDRWLAEHRVR